LLNFLDIGWTWTEF